MFFSRFWRDKVTALEGRIADLEKSNAALTARARERESLLKDQLELFSAQAKAFEKVSDQYIEGLQRARQTIDELQSQANQPVIRANQPLHMSEEEEDAHFMLESGRINMEEYNDILRSIGLSD